MAASLSQDFPGAGPESGDQSSIAELMRVALWEARATERPISALVIVNESHARLEKRYGAEGAEHARQWIAHQILSTADGRDLFAFVDGKRFVVLLPGSELAEVQDHASRLIEIAKEHGFEIAGAHESLRISVGAADGSRPEPIYLETLLQVAREGSIVAGSGGGNRCVHTEVYDSLQARFEVELSEHAKLPPLHAVGEELQLPETTLAGSGIIAVELEPSAAAEVVIPAAVEEELARELDHEFPLESESETSGVRREAVDYAIKHAKTAWSDAAGNLVSKHALEIRRLERRIEKLSGALQNAESTIHDQAEAEFVDPGVPSAFRFVQGLSQGEDNFAIKRELMGMIFEANLALRKKLQDE